MISIHRILKAVGMGSVLQNGDGQGAEPLDSPEKALYRLE